MASRVERLDDADKQSKWAVMAQLSNLSELGDRNQAREWFRDTAVSKKSLKMLGSTSQLS
jgi:hypothetical protein